MGFLGFRAFYGVHAMGECCCQLFDLPIALPITPSVALIQPSNSLGRLVPTESPKVETWAWEDKCQDLLFFTLRA